ncbi:MAG: hypothetical protein HYV09_35955 [Deltaproteobacteria bacterium]|nr:hypothetical protein [Deltaproteobacteria bacterium]
MILAAALVAPTQDVGDADPWRRQVVVDLHAGTRWAPLGPLGLSATWTPSRYAGVEAGFGGLRRDWRWSALGRLHAGGRHHGFAVGAGLSGGPTTFDANGDRCAFLDGAYYLGGGSCNSARYSGSYRLAHAVFANAEAGYETRTSGALHLRAALGYSYRVAERGFQCTDPPCGPNDPLGAGHWYFDLALGGAF